MHTIRSTTGSVGRFVTAFLLAASAIACQGATRPAVKLLYVDLDGTLLDDEGRIPGVNAAALARFRAAGGRFGVATGRMPDRGRPQVEAIRADLPSIFGNGAVVRTASGETIRVEGIADADAVAAMCARITQAGCKQIYVAHANPATGEVRVEMDACRPPTAPGFVTIKLRARVCADHDALLAELPALTGGRFAVIEGGAGDHRGVSIGSEDATKGRAIAFVADRLGIPMSQVAFVGDSGNDVSAARAVLAAGGRCFAVGNAVWALKAACPEHLPLSNAQGAVARVVRILLGTD